MNAMKDQNFNGANILEVGSYDHNGTVRPAFTSFQPNEYIGIDICEGPGVFIKARKTNCTLTDLNPLNLFSILTGDRKHSFSSEEIAAFNQLPEEDLELLWYSPSRRWYRKHLRKPWRKFEKSIVQMLHLK
ncbi:MAG: hypothetical protein HQM07_06250 [Zetaproteobacteria bacterium]|nr:hypothetical protein [Zetaproteobacteria bacterium]